jgi:hypothetical protein
VLFGSFVGAVDAGPASSPYPRSRHAAQHHVTLPTSDPNGIVNFDDAIVVIESDGQQHSHRYRVTTEGHRRALFLSKTHHRLLRDGLAEITAEPTRPARLRAADRAYEAAIDDLLTRAAIAA